MARGATRALAAALVLLPVMRSPAQAGPTQQLLSQYCFDCHSAETREGGLDLRDLLKVHPIVRERDEWRRVAQVIELRSMPPRSSEQPSEQQRMALSDAINGALDRFDYQTVATVGHEPVRRLTHREYNNTLRDLTGVDLRPADRFPRELTGPTGFDNDASTLFLQPALMERYLAAAERVVDAALPAPAEGAPSAEARRLLLHGAGADRLDDDAAAELLRRFMLRAHRRPPSGADLARTTRDYQAARGAGVDPYRALKSVLPAVLISPRFLLRIERAPAGSEPSRVDGFELATRLSYFLWSSTPDDELLRAAQAGELSRASQLREQVNRMISHPNFDEFGSAFGGQWLSTKLIGREIRRDPIDEPWCTDTLMDAMRGETERLIVWLVRQDRPATELLTADYTFINAELARTLYRIKGVEGAEPQKVSLVGSGRRGVLGHAAVLAATSNHNETSPVKRGAYILETILGSPPPPPPPDAGELDDDLADNDSLTFAEKLGRHAADKRCSTCHSRIDPLGYGLERYGAFGRLRRKRPRPPAGDAAVLPDGARVGGAKSLVEYVLDKRRDEFVRNLVRRNLEFALGRRLDYRDEQALRDLVARWEADGLTMKKLLLAIADSPTFQMQQAEPVNQN